MLTRLDKGQYHPDDMVSLAIPLSLPYPVERSGPSPADVPFEHAGEAYRLIGQKFEDDTIFFECIRDYEMTRLSRGLDDYIERTQVPSSDNDALLVFKINKDYMRAQGISLECLIGFGHVNTPDFQELFSSYKKTIESPPPDFCS